VTLLGCTVGSGRSPDTATERGPPKPGHRRALLGPAAGAGGVAVVVGVALWRTNAIPRLSGPTGPTALDPAAFSPGACMAYAPLRGDRHRTVFLDAGRGGVDPGGVGSTEGGQSVDESQVNLRIELATMARSGTAGRGAHQRVGHGSSSFTMDRSGHLFETAGSQAANAVAAMVDG
jgi:hypothetical protein